MIGKSLPRLAAGQAVAVPIRIFANPPRSTPRATGVLVLCGPPGLHRATSPALRQIRWNSGQQSGRPKSDFRGEESKSSSGDHETGEKGLGGKVRKAWSTPTKWYPIPIAVGALVLLAVQLRKETRDTGLEVESQGEGGAVVKSRTVNGPWQVQVMGALPLRSLSQLWGYLNSLVLPMWFRPFGFKLYSAIFGCNLEECTPEDLRQYESLGEFFYRELKPGMRPIADGPMVSPADGRVLHFGQIEEERVEQVKGITYSLQALLGHESRAYGDRTEVVRETTDDPSLASILGPTSSTSPSSSQAPSKSRWRSWSNWYSWVRRSKPSSPVSSEDHQQVEESPKRSKWYSWFLRSKKPKTEKQNGDTIEVVDDKNFAKINDVPYSLRGLLGFKRRGKSADTDTDDDSSPTRQGVPSDASRPGQTDLSHDASVAMTLGTAVLQSASDSESDITKIHPENRLYFFVVYLAPGDYHRFHSPTTWVVERRRHFTGDLFSVSPYIANRLKDLFVMNERVALLGRWKHGFYSMIPVGATNVGSIRINFDETLRTNTRTMTHPAHTFTEAVYTSASILQGQPLLAGEEMGGFRLGSTIVLVFEAPKNWKFTVKAGETIKVGEPLGRFIEKAEEKDLERKDGRIV